MLKKIQCRKGVLLIEIMLTVTILSAGLVMIVQALMSVSRSDHLNADYLVAAHMARNVLSDLQFLGPSSRLKIDKGFDKFELARSEAKSVEEPEKTFSKKETFSTEEEEPEPEPQKEEYDLDVLWQSGDLEKRLSFATFVSIPKPPEPEDEKSGKEDDPKKMKEEIPGQAVPEEPDEIEPEGAPPDETEGTPEPPEESLP